MDFNALDTDTLRALLASPMIGEPTKERIRAKLDRLEPAAVPGNVLKVRAKPKPADRDDFDSETERRFWRDHVEPRLASGELEAAVAGRWKVKLADGCWYRVDVLTVEKGGRLWFHEVKGARIWDGAIEKAKMAAEANRWARWTVWQWKAGGWTVLHDFNTRESEG